MNGSQQKRRRQKWFRAFGKRRARRTPGRRLAVEPMEGRVLMTADLGGNSFAAATELGTLSGTRQIADFVGNSDVNDFYRIRLAQPWNCTPHNAALQIATAAGASVSQDGDIAPAIRSRAINCNGAGRTPIATPVFRLDNAVG